MKLSVYVILDFLYVMAVISSKYWKLFENVTLPQRQNVKLFANKKCYAKLLKKIFDFFFEFYCHH